MNDFFIKSLLEAFDAPDAPPHFSDALSLGREYGKTRKR